MGTPFLLLQWVDFGEPKEVIEISKKYSEQVKMVPIDASTKQQVIDSIKNWIVDNSNAQDLFIGTHGIGDIGIGLSGDDVLTWDELWDVFYEIKDNKEIGLWIGACKSSLGPILWNSKNIDIDKIPFGYVVGFKNDIKPEKIKKVLSKLIESTDTEDIITLDKLIPSLKKITADAEIYFFEKEDKKYINLDEFEKIKGISFEKYSQSNSIRPDQYKFVNFLLNYKDE